VDIHRPEISILTVEDPVEYTFDGIGQTQIRPAIGLTFARAIRSVVRQDPDVIMIGELRDLEMANLAVQVALTGHLVLTTLHAQTSAGAVQRLIDIGLERFLVNSALSGIISQRLIRVLCEKCKQPAEPALHSMPTEAIQIVTSSPEARFFGPVGCEQCRQMGYRGRQAIYEILVMDDRLREVVAAKGSIAAVRDAAMASGMRTMLACGLVKAAQGVTSIEEVLRVVPHGLHT
jgi:type II secretory ATPase GspE/PulE/Tfp pilus assembly ATPase PilB-like protein